MDSGPLCRKERILEKLNRKGRTIVVTYGFGYGSSREGFLWMKKDLMNL